MAVISRQCSNLENKKNAPVVDRTRNTWRANTCEESNLCLSVWLWPWAADDPSREVNHVKCYPMSLCIQ